MTTLINPDQTNAAEAHRIRRARVRYSTPRQFIGIARYEWSVRRAWRTRRAALRGTWWWLMRRYPCELCQDCGRPVGHEIGGTYWHADDDLWNEVSGLEGERAEMGLGGTLCCRCFTQRCYAKGVRIWWQPKTAAEAVV